MSFLMKTDKPKTIATRDLEDERVQAAARDQARQSRSIRGETLLTSGAIPSPGVSRRQLVGG